MEIHPTMLDQIHFSVCMYITMWVAKKEEYAQMIEAKLNDFCWLNQKIVDLLVIKEIIFGFWIHNAINILQGKQIF